MRRRVLAVARQPGTETSISAFCRASKCEHAQPAETFKKLSLCLGSQKNGPQFQTPAGGGESAQGGEAPTSCRGGDQAHPQVLPRLHRGGHSSEL